MWTRGTPIGDASAVASKSARLPGGLSVLADFTVVSTQELADKVNDRLLADKMRRGREEEPLVVAPVPEFEKLGGLRRAVMPMDLLHGLGRTTSALPGLSELGAAGLPGLNALRLTCQWAIARYLWLFAADRRLLRLSGLTDEVRRHQRALLSEHLGIALATDLVERYLVGEDFRVVDADAVSYDRYLQELAAELGVERPDYFWYALSGVAIRDLVIVEVKGAKDSRLTDQLARGARQVSLPQALRGVRTRRVVIGASANPSGVIVVKAVELLGPPSNRAETTAELLVADRASKLDDNLIASVQEHTRDIPTVIAAEAATGPSETADDARLLTFAGKPQTASTLRSARLNSRSVLDGLETIDAFDRPWRGRSLTIPTATGPLTIHTATDEAVLQAAVTPSTASLRRTRPTGPPLDRDERGLVPATVQGRRDAAAIATAAVDGTLLAFSGDRETISALTD